MSNLEVGQLTSLIHRLREEAPPEADGRKGVPTSPEDFFEDYSSKGSREAILPNMAVPLNLG